MGRTRRDADEGVLRDCEHGGPAASASYPRLGGGYAVRGVMGQLVSYRGSSVRGRRVHPTLLCRDRKRRTVVVGEERVFLFLESGLCCAGDVGCTTGTRNRSFDIPGT